MRTYQLKDWEINIQNKSMEAYNYVCDEKNLIISTKSNEYVAFIEVNQKENLVLQKMSYFIHYKFHSDEKKLDIIILSDKRKENRKEII